MRAFLRTPFLALLLSGTACLEPLSSDDIGLDRIFGDPRIPPDQVPHVEDNPELRARVDVFPSEVPFMKGFADGEPIWYWRVPGPAPSFIAPEYVVVERSGVEHTPIIDVLPGDAGYSPWWRRVIVRTTEKYNGERIWSRAAVDAGVRTGILEPPEETNIVVSCPVVQRKVRVVVDSMTGADVGPTWAYYRNQRVSWIVFAASDIEVDVGVREMPAEPLYVLQRVDQPHPLFEFVIGIDLNGDSKLVSSNNIFRAKPGAADYSPMWYPVGVRTVADYVSFDTVTASTTIGLTDEGQFVGPNYDVVISDLVIPPLRPEKDAFEMCPIQRARGEL